jgi:hypothetical protein
MPSPTVDELKDKIRFEEMMELAHNDFIGFSREYYLRRKSWVTSVHYFLSLLAFLVWLVYGLQDRITFGIWITQIGCALAAFVILLAIHELIHGLAYMASGAKDVRYRLCLRHGYAYVIAHNFVAGSGVFALVVLAPFAILSGVLVAACFLAGPHQYFVLSLLLIHTICTAGDFALLNYLWVNRRHDIYKFDDVLGAKSYFYRRIEQ